MFWGGNNRALPFIITRLFEPPSKKRRPGVLERSETETRDERRRQRWWKRGAKEGRRRWWPESTPSISTRDFMDGTFFLSFFGFFPVNRSNYFGGNRSIFDIAICPFYVKIMILCVLCRYQLVNLFGWSSICLFFFWMIRFRLWISRTQSL